MLIVSVCYSTDASWKWGAPSGGWHFYFVLDSIFCCLGSVLRGLAEVEVSFQKRSLTL